MPISHRVNWIGDKTRRFCPVSKCGVNWVLSCLDPVSNLQLFSLKYTEDYWKLYWLVDNSVHTTDTDKTRPCRRCEIGTKIQNGRHLTRLAILWSTTSATEACNMPFSTSLGSRILVSSYRNAVDEMRINKRAKWQTVTIGTNKIFVHTVKLNHTPLIA